MEIWQICLIIGAIGLILVLMFSLAMGVGNGNLTPMVSFNNKTCDPGTKKVDLPPRYSKVADKASYKQSTMFSPGTCPTGYTFFNDLDGNSLCCGSSNINIFDRSCAARGSQGVCAFVPGIIDPRSDSQSYPLCSDIAAAEQLKKSGSLCPIEYKYHVSLPSKSYKCCASHVTPGAVDCNSGSKFCSGLQQGQTVFNTPESCETKVLLNSIECPDSTHLINDFKNRKTAQFDFIFYAIIMAGFVLIYFTQFTNNSNKDFLYQNYIIQI